jgi:hypothetical protein
MSWIPAARSAKWWMYAGVSSLVATVAFWVVRFILLDKPFVGVYAFRFLLLAVILSFLFGFLGWLGARWLWLCSTAGLASGLIMMALYSRDMTGWEDLASFVSFMLAVAAGFVLGIVVEVIILIIRMARK